jgi:hypothetical protein
MQKILHCKRPVSSSAAIQVSYQSCSVVPVYIIIIYSYTDEAKRAMREFKLFNTRKPYYYCSRMKTSAAINTILLSLAAYAF